MEIKNTSDEVQKEKLAKSFRKIHGISMVLNLILIICGLVYLAFIPAIIRV